MNVPRQHLDSSARRQFLRRTAALAGTGLVAPRAAFAADATPSGTSGVTVKRRGSDILVEAYAELDAAIDTAWSTLVDYDRLTDFIPDMSVSRTLARSGSSVLVEQKGRATFGPFGQQFAFLLEVDEQPERAIHAVAVQGDFRRFDARYELMPLAPRRMRLDYRASLQPNAPVPPLVGLTVMRAMIRRQFEAMAGEIVRRAKAS